MIVHGLIRRILGLAIRSPSIVVTICILAVYSWHTVKIGLSTVVVGVVVVGVIGDLVVDIRLYRVRNRF